MQIDKKTLRNLFVLAMGCIIFAWLVLDTGRVQALLGATWSLISPFVTGTAIACVFNVPMRAIERQIESIRNQGLRRFLAIILTILALALIITFVVELLIPQIQQTTETLVVTIPDFVIREVNNLTKFLDNHPEMQAWVMENTDLANFDWSKLIQKLVTFIGDGMSSVLNSVWGVIAGFTSGIINAFISIAFAVYSLSRKEILARQGRRILYSVAPERTSDEIVRVLRLTNTTFSNFISGQCLEALILGCLFAVVMMILDMPYIALVSVIISVTALVPLVGAFVGCFLGAFFILVDNPFQAVTFVAMFLVLQQLENNLIYPRVVGTSIGLPGMWVLVAVTVGGELMGVAGMLVMIPLASVVYALLREFTERRLVERKVPVWKLMNQPPEIKSRFRQNRERKKELKILKKMRELKEKRPGSQK